MHSIQAGDPALMPRRRRRRLRVGDHLKLAFLGFIGGRSQCVSQQGAIPLDLSQDSIPAHFYIRDQAVEPLDRAQLEKKRMSSHVFHCQIC